MVIVVRILTRVLIRLWFERTPPYNGFVELVKIERNFDYFENLVKLRFHRFTFDKTENSHFRSWPGRGPLPLKGVLLELFH